MEEFRTDDRRRLAPRLWERTLVLLLASVPLTLVCAFIGFLQAGVGHGSYAAFIIFFPYGFASVVLFEDALGPKTGDALFVLTVLVQFPLYALTLGMAGRRGKFKRALIALLSVHILVAAFILLS